jgi:NhaA family Na+:H+ antiporter
MHAPAHPPPSVFRRFLDSEASGGLVLMAVAVLALVIANSPLALAYFAILKMYVFGLSILHWINDALMAVFFLLVGLEIKREFLDGQLSSWPRRILPGIAATGGMILPALIYAAFNFGDPVTIRGWAIPAATDIAFALASFRCLARVFPSRLRYSSRRWPYSMTSVLWPSSPCSTPPTCHSRCSGFPARPCLLFSR